ncbi:MAG: peptidoglycan binding domain-containing protein [Lachnospiraceae bacterium]|nr:peptidoglycan binding domain-containing protein [Lachnospiraceae bacterium]
MKKSAIAGLAVGGVALIALAAGYGTGRRYYKDHLFSGTMINGVDCSNMTADMAKDELQYEMDHYQLTVSERGGLEDTLIGKDMDFLFTDSGEIDRILSEQNINTWFVKVSGEKNYEIENDFTYSEEKLETLVREFQCFKEENIIQPENAVPVLTGDAFTAQAEKEGALIDQETVIAAVKEAVLTDENTLDLDAAGLYTEPAIRQDNPELLARIDNLNSMIAADVTYDFVDVQFHLEKAELANWFVSAEDGTVSVDRDQAAAWVRNMAYETDTFGLAKDFTTSYGVTITLEGGGDYGYCIDQDATVDQLLGFIDAGETIVTEPIYLYTAMDRSGNTIGNSYVEICISTQTLWLYWNGELITSTPVITGSDTKGYSTPSGSVWAIDGKKNDWNFTTFPNAWSKWWMPFNDQVGLHDARWQSASYYEIPGYYIDSGSHGCVNIPDAPMEQIFYYMEIGYPVVVYYSVDQVVGPVPFNDLISG